MNIYELQPDFPQYIDVKVGDIFVWFVGNEAEWKDNVIQVHGHWFQVVYKDARIAQLDVKLLRCDKPTKVSCHEERGTTMTLGWSKLQYWAHKTRWLRTPASQVLFRERGE
jgi:FtsP/CotA-like multicopper oxidase with cupredoxin domain